MAYITYVDSLWMSVHKHAEINWMAIKDLNCKQ